MWSVVQAELSAVWQGNWEKFAEPESLELWALPIRCADALRTTNLMEQSIIRYDNMSLFLSLITFLR